MRKLKTGSREKKPWWITLAGVHKDENTVTGKTVNILPSISSSRQRGGSLKARRLEAY